MKSANSRSSSRARSGSVRTKEAIAARQLETKCGLIWARRARSSASIARVRSRPRSASSAWVASHTASSSVALTSPGELDGPYAASAATTRSRATTGAMTAKRSSQSGSPQATSDGPRTTVRLPTRAAWACPTTSLRWCSPGPSQARTPLGSVTAIDGAARRVRRCLAAFPTPAGVSPSRRVAAAREAVCRVRYVASSTSLPKRLRLEAPTRASVPSAASAAATRTTSASDALTAVTLRSAGSGAADVRGGIR